MSRNIFVITTGTDRVEARDTAKHPTMHGTTLNNKEFSSSKSTVPKLKNSTLEELYITTGQDKKKSLAGVRL